MHNNMRVCVQGAAANWYDKRTASRLKQTLFPDPDTGKQFHDIGGTDMRGAEL